MWSKYVNEVVYFSNLQMGSKIINYRNLGRQTGQGIKILSPESHFSSTHEKKYILCAFCEVICRDM